MTPHASILSSLPFPSQPARRTALHEAAAWHRDARMLAQLLDAKARVDAVDAVGAGVQTCVLSDSVVHALCAMSRYKPSAACQTDLTSQEALASDRRN